VVPPEQVRTQFPFTQLSAEGHTLPQAPQLATSVCTLAQNGAPASGTQALWPEAHASMQVAPAQM
jgi:hypothetical protein